METNTWPQRVNHIYHACKKKPTRKTRQAYMNSLFSVLIFYGAERALARSRVKKCIERKYEYDGQYVHSSQFPSHRTTRCHRSTLAHQRQRQQIILR